MNADKAKLRRRMLLLRNKMTAYEKSLGSKLIIGNFIKYFMKVESKIIAGFKAINSEPNLDQLYLKLVEKNTICFPLIMESNLKFGSWNIGEEFVIDKRFQIPEPGPKSKVVLPDILLVPLLATDIMGNRLGYGGGFYDSYLQDIAKLKEVIAIGICFEFQILDEIPVEENDQKLNYIVTNNRVIKV